MFTLAVTMKSWFRALAAACPDEGIDSPRALVICLMYLTALAQTLAGISILAYSVYTGYSLPLPSMIGALKWISYLNVCTLLQ